MSGERPIPYSRQSIDQDDIDAVVDVLQSHWLTTGPMVAEFERAVAARSECDHGVAFSSGTAALHAMMHASCVEPGDEVIVPAITFVASANAVLYLGGTPVFADVCESRLLIDPADVERKITPNTKAILAVDYAGHPCDYQALRAICDRHGVQLLADASHSIGAMSGSVPSATLADMTCFSFHPVKPVTTGEGGMVVCHDPGLCQVLKAFRGHGINVDFRQRAERQDWRYQMESLGYNYRLSDIHAALGVSQLRKLDSWIEAKQEIAERYQQEIGNLQPWVTALTLDDSVRHSWHLFVIQWSCPDDGWDRDWLFRRMRSAGIGVNVHYEPIYRHPYYQQSVPTARSAQCPVAEQVANRILSLPIYAGMTDRDQDRVLSVLRDCVRQAGRQRVA